MSSPLFSPLTIGDFNMKHRVVMAPLTRMRASVPGAAPTDLNAAYYGQRASEGGLIITEATQISPQGKGLPRTPGIHTDEQVGGWKKVVDAVHARGGRIVLQLWHMGRSAHSSHRADGSLPVSPSAIAPSGSALGPNFEPLPFETPRALEAEEIPGIVEQYVQAALRAGQAGFDGVEVHAANGFLIDQFLQDGSNHRTDTYGGSIENRARFLLEVTDAVVGAVGASRVGVRFSPFGTLGNMSDSDPMATFTYAIEAVSRRKLAYLHLVEPRANTGQTDEVNMELPNSAAALFRRSFIGPIIASGGFSRETAEEIIRNGSADAVAFGRFFISNPDLPKRFEIGAPLAPYNRATFYNGADEGYTDYPTLVAAE